MDTIEPVEVLMEREKETPNTFRYQEIVPKTGALPVLRTVYVQKSVLEKLGNPDVIKVTIGLADV